MSDLDFVFDPFLKRLQRDSLGSTEDLRLLLMYFRYEVFRPRHKIKSVLDVAREEEIVDNHEVLCSKTNETVFIYDQQPKFGFLASAELEDSDVKFLEKLLIQPSPPPKTISKRLKLFKQPNVTEEKLNPRPFTILPDVKRVTLVTGGRPIENRSSRFIKLIRNVPQNERLELPPIVPLLNPRIRNVPQNERQELPPSVPLPNPTESPRNSPKKTRLEQISENHKNFNATTQPVQGAEAASATAPSQPPPNRECEHLLHKSVCIFCGESEETISATRRPLPSNSESSLIIGQPSESTGSPVSAKGSAHREPVKPSGKANSSTNAKSSGQPSNNFDTAETTFSTIKLQPQPLNVVAAPVMSTMPTTSQSQKVATLAQPSTNVPSSAGSAKSSKRKRHLTNCHDELPSNSSQQGALEATQVISMSAVVGPTSSVIIQNSSFSGVPIVVNGQLLTTDTASKPNRPSLTTATGGQASSSRADSSSSGPSKTLAQSAPPASDNGQSSAKAPGTNNRKSSSAKESAKGIKTSRGSDQLSVGAEMQADPHKTNGKNSTTASKGNGVISEKSKSTSQRLEAHTATAQKPTNNPKDMAQQVTTPKEKNEASVEPSENCPTTVWLENLSEVLLLAASNAQNTPKNRGKGKSRTKQISSSTQKQNGHSKSKENGQTEAPNNNGLLSSRQKENGQSPGRSKGSRSQTTSETNGRSSTSSLKQNGEPTNEKVRQNVTPRKKQPPASSASKSVQNEEVEKPNTILECLTQRLFSFPDLMSSDKNLLKYLLSAHIEAAFDRQVATTYIDKTLGANKALSAERIRRIRLGLPEPKPNPVDHAAEDLQRSVELAEKVALEAMAALRPFSSARPILSDGKQVQAVISESKICMTKQWKGRTFKELMLEFEDHLLKVLFQSSYFQAIVEKITLEHPSFVFDEKLARSKVDLVLPNTICEMIMGLMVAELPPDLSPASPYGLTIRQDVGVYRRQRETRNLTLEEFVQHFLADPDDEEFVKRSANANAGEMVIPEWIKRGDRSGHIITVLQNPEMTVSEHYTIAEDPASQSKSKRRRDRKKKKTTDTTMESASDEEEDTQKNGLTEYNSVERQAKPMENVQTDQGATQSNVTQMSSNNGQAQNSTPKGIATKGNSAQGNGNAVATQAQENGITGKGEKKKKGKKGNSDKGVTQENGSKPKVTPTNESNQSNRAVKQENGTSTKAFIDKDTQTLPACLASDPGADPFVKYNQIVSGTMLEALTSQINLMTLQMKRDAIKIKQLENKSQMFETMHNLNETIEKLSKDEVEYFMSRDLTFREDMEAVLEDLICPICHGILNDPAFVICGHVYCNGCIELMKNRFICVRCPGQVEVSYIAPAHQMNSLSVKISKIMASKRFKEGKESEGSDSG